MSRSRLVWRFLPILILTLASRAFGQGQDSIFVPVPPCRVVDSRISQGIGGPLAPGVAHPVSFRLWCGIPIPTEDGGLETNRATALALNIVAVTPAGFGHLVAWPSNRPMPTASIINYSGGQNIANGVIVPMCDEWETMGHVCENVDISFLAAVSSTHLVVDVTGYYIKPVKRGSARHGTGAGYDELLCVDEAARVRFGLSSHMAERASAEFLCPAGTWLCGTEEINFGVACDTSRIDSACDLRRCDGSCQNNPDNNHIGWVSNASDVHGNGWALGEAASLTGEAACLSLPSWCCSKL